MKKNCLYLIIFLISYSASIAQDLNWGTSGFVSGSLTHNFGAIGTPASTVTLTVSGTTLASIPAINSGPAVVNINANGALFDCNNCALRTGVTFNNYTDKRTFTFTFSPAVAGLFFNLYDIDGDSVVVAASGPAGIPTVSIVPQNGSEVKILGNGTSTASVTGNNITTPPSYSNQNANPNSVNFSGYVSTIVISYYMHQRDPGFPGTPSFSIGNMSWPSVLPIRWTSLSGKLLTTGTNELKWTVANEGNTDQYIVERTKDLKSYSTIATIQKTAVTENSQITYTYIDNSSGPGNSFYRIKRVGMDYSFDYSSIIVVRSGNFNKIGVMVFPDESNQFIYLINNDNIGIESVLISDNNGKLLLQKRHPENKIGISSLSSGLYYIRIIKKSGELSVSSFIKK